MRRLKEYREFIARGNVVDLAVGLIMGAAFTGIVNSLVKDVVMPPIGILTGGVDFTDLYLNLSGGDYPSLIAATERSEEHTSELQSLMRISYAVFCLKKTKGAKHTQHCVDKYK